MKNSFLRLFYDEIAKCSVHSNIFVKPKQCVSCLLVLWCFSPWFCKFSRLVCSVLKVFVRMSSRFFITSAMDFNVDYLQFPSVNFLKTLCSCSNRANVKHIQILKKSTDKFLRNRYSRISQNLSINLPSNFDMFFLYKVQIA